MKIINKEILAAFSKRPADVRKSINRWVEDVEQANWQTLSDIKAAYATVSILADNRFVFNIKGNDCRLLIKVFFSRGILRIEAVGTYQEYDKWEL